MKEENFEAAPDCPTCRGNGMIGGPSYYAPDEGGVPCPDCWVPSAGDEALNASQSALKPNERTVLRDLAQALAWQCFGECRGYSERLLSPIDALAAARAVLDSTAAQTTQQAGEATRPVGVAGKMPGTDGFTMACFKAVDVPFGTLLYATPQPAAQAAPAVPLTDLHKFYGVESDAALIAAQQRHIEKLQARMPSTPSLAPQRPREG